MTRSLPSARTAPWPVVIAALLATTSAGLAHANDPFAVPRQQMVDAIAAMARATHRETGREQFADEVMRAMATVPRHRFVPERLVDDAYRNQPLPIGKGQTISQPYIVALSTDLVAPQAGHVVLEIGTGSGYQAAVLATLVKHVYSVEIVASLGNDAARLLTTLGYPNVDVRIGDGYQGWPEKAPFDGIVVTAAAPFVPQPLVDQLKPGGRMVIPVGPSQLDQELLLIEKLADGTVTRRVVLPVRFVPMTGQGVRSKPHP